jgi:hypothetical protein
MVVHKIGTELPWKLERKDPYARKPHTGVIVEIATTSEFTYPVIKEGKSGSTLNRLGVIFVSRVLLTEIGKRFPVGPPHLRTQLKPPLPVGSPHNLLNELLSHLKRMVLKGGCDTLLLSYHTIPNPLREPRHLLMAGPIKIPLIGIRSNSLLKV